MRARARSKFPFTEVAVDDKQLAKLIRKNVAKVEKAAKAKTTRTDVQAANALCATLSIRLHFTRTPDTGAPVISRPFAGQV